MTKEQRQLLFELAQQTLTEMGGRGSAADVASHLRASHPDVFQAEAERGWIIQVRNALRRKDVTTGLPAAVSVADHEYVQLEILSADEYEYAVVSYLRRAKANRKVAQKMADQCLVTHGVTIDVAAIERNLA